MQKHVDITSRTDVSVQYNLRRFRPIAARLGISFARLEPNGSFRPHPTLPVGLLETGAEAQWKALTQLQVTFAKREDIGHALERNTQHISEMNSQKNLLIQDEVDTDVETGAERFIISGEEEPTCDLLSGYWQVFSLPQQQPGAPAPEGYLDQTQMKKFNAKTKEWIDKSTHIEQTLMKDIEKPKDRDKRRMWQNTRRAMALTQRISSHFDDMRKVTPYDWKSHYFDKQGYLKPVGEYDLYSRLYADIQNIPYHPTLQVPQEWCTYFQTILPSHILTTIEQASIMKGVYTVKNNHIEVLDPDTGYPKPGSEFEPLVTLALYAKESIKNPQLRLPNTLHETAESMTPEEVVALRYWKIIGLTGTGQTTVDWFEKVHNLKSTLLPPNYKDRIEILPRFDAINMQEKHKALAADILASPDIPTLVDTGSLEEQKQVVDVLKKTLPDTVFIRELTAHNSEEAKTIFDEAGRKRTVTVVCLMAGREVDIPVADDVNASKGLRVFSASPRKLERNQEQLFRRTGRFGQRGIYKEYTCPADDVYTILSTSDIDNVKRAFEKGDSARIAAYQKKAQREWEVQHYKTNSILRNRTLVFVPIRRRMGTLDQKTRERIQPFWRDFSTIAETLGSTSLNPQWASLGDEARGHRWQAHVAKKFEEMVNIAETNWVSEKFFQNQVQPQIHQLLNNFQNDLI